MAVKCEIINYTVLTFYGQNKSVKLLNTDHMVLLFTGKLAFRTKATCPCHCANSLHKDKPNHNMAPHVLCRCHCHASKDEWTQPMPVPFFLLSLFSVINLVLFIPICQYQLPCLLSYALRSAESPKP